MKLFTKKALPLAIAAAMAPGFANAAEISGFADIIYTITDDANKPEDSAAKHPTERKFGANGEVNVSVSPTDGVTVRVDVDLALDPGDGNSGAQIEQAFFAWAAAEGVTVLGGVFNNPIGYEAEDAPDMDFTSHGAVYTALDSQTKLDGDNVAGLGAAFGVGPVTITAALLNDIGETAEENSFAFIANYSPMDGLDMEFGMVTQAENKYTAMVESDGSSNGLSVGDATNFNIVYTGVENLTVGVDYLIGTELLESAYDLWLGYNFGKFGVKVRQSAISYNTRQVNNMVKHATEHPGENATLVADLASANLAGADESSTTLYLSYQVASNLSAALEIRKDSKESPLARGVAAVDTDTATLELIAKF